MSFHAKVSLCANMTTGLKWRSTFLKPAQTKYIKLKEADRRKQSFFILTEYGPGQISTKIRPVPGPDLFKIKIRMVLVPDIFKVRIQPDSVPSER